MKCPHCSIEFHDTWSLEAKFDGGADCDRIFVEKTQCPACNRMIVKGRFDKHDGLGRTQSRYVTFHPLGFQRPVPPEVPPEISAEFLEAVSVLSLSPKASAALSRRNLQSVLRSACNIQRPSLSEEIQAFIDLPSTPQSLKEVVDAVRNVGNFAAHPIKSTSSGSVVDVEPHEAEWLLEVLEALFEHVYVQPARAKAKKDALNAKLADAKKPRMK